MAERSFGKFFSVLLISVLLISLLSATPISTVGYEGSLEENVVLIRDIESELDISDLEHRGEVLDVYGSYVLFQANEQEVLDLDSNYEIDRLKHRNELNVKGYEFDSSEGYPELNEALQIQSYEPGTEGLYVIDMVGPVNPEWTEELEDMGVDLINYIPNYAFEARMTPEQAEEVEEMFFVDWTGIFQPEFKLAEDLEPGKIDIVLVEETRDETLDRVFERTKVHSVKDLPTYGTQVRAEVEELSTFSELALLEDVYHISNHVEPEIFGEVATQTIGGGHWIWDPADDPYHPWRGSEDEEDYGAHVNHLGYEGDGVTVTVADTGILDTHPDFQDRVVDGYSYTDDGDWRDDQGHGTHCAGSVAANTYEGSGDTVDDHWETDVEDYFVAQGIAPQAELFSQKIFEGGEDFVGPTSPYSEIITDAREKSDTYIHSNSWGGRTEGGYYESDRDYDSIVRDAGDGEPMVITVAAGNDGVDDETGEPIYQSIGSPGNAKNVITVGASETFYPGLAEEEELYEADPDRTAIFSSRGWTEDSRVKPDVTAPGLYVFSTYIDEDDPSIPSYAGMGGTSMANPAVAGAASVIAEWYEERFDEKPSPAMIKALMINTAYEMEPQPGDFYTDHIPNRDEGWGIVNLPALIDAESEFLIEDQSQDSLLQTGDFEEYTHSFDEASEPLKVSLTWTDEEAQVGDTDVLKNDLNLEVISPSGDEYRGNAFENGWTQADTNTMEAFDDTGDGWDDTNNVENVYIHPDDLEEGDYTFRVIGENIPADSNNDGTSNQDYALVVYNVEGVGPPQMDLETPTGGEYWQFGEDREVRWEAVEGGGTITGVDLEYSIDGGSSWNYIEEGLEASGSYTWEVPEEPTDEAKVRATVVDDQGQQDLKTSDEFIMTKLYSPREPRPGPEETHIDRDANLSVLVEHAGFGEDERLLKSQEFEDPIEREDARSLGSAGNWEWLYDADWRDRPDMPIGSEEPGEWYGAMILDLSDQIGEEITHVAYAGNPEAGSAQAFVAEEDGGAPGDWLASSDIVEPEDPPSFTEMELDNSVDITSPGEYWIVVQVEDPGQTGVFGGYDGFIEDGGWMATEQPHEPDAWTELSDQGLDFSWALEARVPKDLYFEVDIVDYDEVVDPGDEVLVNYEVTNIGEAEDTQQIDFSVNGMLEDSIETTLESDEVHEGEFTWIAEDIGEYDLTVASADESEQVTVTVEDPSDFEINIIDHDKEVVEGDSLELKYTATNVGNAAGTQQIEFKVEGEVEDTEEVTLEVDEGHEGRFSWIAGEPGTYNLEVASFDDEEEVSVTVELSMEVTFYDASDDSEIGRVENVASEERASIIWDELDYDTTYQWYAAVDDGRTTETSEIWSFTTEPDSHFQVEIVDIPQEIVEGEETAVNYVVTNTGQTSDVQPIEFFIEENLVDKEDEIDLAAGESYEGEFTWTPAEEGYHSLEISSRDESASRDYTVLGPPYFEIEIGDHPEEMAAGSELLVEYSVVNIGEAGGSQEIEFVVDEDIKESIKVELASGEEYDDHFIWQSEVGDIGEHHLKITSEDSESTSTVKVVDPPTFEIDLYHETEVIEGSSIIIDYIVTNTGGIEDTQTIEIKIEGEIQESEEVTLESGEDHEEFFIWQTEEGDAGEHELVISSQDGEESGMITVLEEAFFEVEIISPRDGQEFQEGEEITIEYEVRNTGEADDTQRIDFIVQGEIQESEEITLEGGEEYAGEFRWTSQEGDAGDYDIIVESSDDEDVGTDAFTVLEGDIDFLGDYWWIFLLLAIIVILIIVGVSRKRSGSDEEDNPCPDCGGEMRFIDQYDSWYCDGCEDYKSEGSVAGGVNAAQQEQSNHICSDCGGEMRFIDQYDRWYCDSCEEYQ